MKQGIILLLALFALTAAMVPRDKRAVNTEEEEERLRTQNTPPAAPTDKPGGICPPQTPCGWSVYRPNSKIIQMTIDNNYCKCSPEMTCLMLEDDTSAGAYVHRCRPPSFTSDFES